MAPTERQLEILTFIHEATRRDGWAPSHREIGERFGIAWSSARRLLRQLETKGLVFVAIGKGRGTSLTSRGLNSLPRCPRCGAVAMATFTCLGCHCSGCVGGCAKCYCEVAA
jgi:SOS-response transcriptional repressor LexA